MARAQITATLTRARGTTSPASGRGEMRRYFARFADTVMWIFTSSLTFGT